jgi:hypothetical protein
LVGVHLTPSAREALAKLLSRRAGTDRCLRLNTNQGKYRFIIDEPIEQDIAYQHEDRTVLVVSETVARDLWGITVDTTPLDDGKQKLIFRKARHGEPLEAVRDDAPMVPPEWRAQQHALLLEEIADIGRQIQSLRGSTKKMMRDQLHVLEASRQQKWDAVRAVWAGDGGWHKLNGIGAPTADAQPTTKQETPSPRRAAQMGAST